MDGEVLLTDMAAADVDKLEYVAMVEYIPLMPRTFLDALVWRLAVELALAIAKKPDVSQYAYSEYRRSLSIAMAYDENRHQEPEPRTPSLVTRDQYAER